MEGAAPDPKLLEALIAFGSITIIYALIFGVISYFWARALQLSKWKYALLSAIPFVGHIVMIVLMCKTIGAISSLLKRVERLETAGQA